MSSEQLPTCVPVNEQFSVAHLPRNQTVCVRAHVCVCVGVCVCVYEPLASRACSPAAALIVVWL